MKLQAVFWDFDGVVLDSVEVKTRAFARMFSAYGPEIEKAVVDYHLVHGGISRFEKFRYYYNQLLNKSISEEEIHKLGVEFSGLVLEEVLAAPFIPGAFFSLNKLLEKGVPAYVVSGTPEVEVRHIVQMRQLSKYFIEVHGSPRTKKEILSDILCRQKYEARRCLFLGDAMTDYDSANDAGVPFIGIIANSQQSCFPEGTNVMRKVDLSIL